MAKSKAEKEAFAAAKAAAKAAKKNPATIAGDKNEHVTSAMEGKRRRN
jgi:hypothetical protein